MNTAPKHDPAPREPGDAESYLRSRAATYRDVAEAEARDGASRKRVGLTLRMAAYYAEAAEALAAMDCGGRAAALGDLESMLG